MKKHFSGLLAVALLLSGCSWLSSLNLWAEEKPAADVQEVMPETRGVNRYLWQASLEKMSRMPLLKTDLENGTIVSDWMVVNGVPNEKFKITVRVLCPELRADGLKVNVSKMNRIGGEWTEGQTDRRLNGEIEKIILKQASVLYRRAVAAGEE